MDAMSRIIDTLKILGDGQYSVFSFVQMIAVLSGFIILFIACIRLTKHGKAQKMFRYYAPSTTFFMFFTGVMLISISGFTQMLTSTFFPDANMTDINQISSYLQHLQPDSTDIETAQKYLVYALVNIIGFISLIRGTFLLINISEGKAQGGLSQVISHLIAGVIGMNAQFFLTLAGGMYSMWV